MQMDRQWDGVSGATQDCDHVNVKERSYDAVYREMTYTIKSIYLINPEKYLRRQRET